VSAVSGVGGRIAIVSAGVGAGHDGVAAELARRLGGAGYPVDRHDFLAMLPRWQAAALAQGYTRSLRAAPWTYRAAIAAFDRSGPARLAAGACRAADARLVAGLAADTAVVVSTYPFASQCIGRLRRAGRLPVPAVTYLTDPAVHRTWVAPGIDAHLTPYGVAGAAARQLGAAGVQVVAPAVAPGFRPPADRYEVAASRAKFDLPEEQRLVLIVAGSLGLGEPERTAREVLATGIATPVVVCGRHATLRQRLAGVPGVHALGWVGEMPTLMRAVDVAIDNAGGLTFLEAVASGLPVLCYRPLAGHGQANVAGLHASGLAVWVRQADQLRTALATALSAPGGRAAADVLGRGIDPATWITDAMTPVRPVLSP
jgi:UDP-N-acetylglucosamine:LPS N-acetylglucosamine transferase